MKTLKELQDAGGFVPDKPLARTITFKLDGEDEYTAVVHIKKLSIGDQENIFLAADEGRRSRAATMISHCVTLGEQGKEKVPFTDAFKMHPGLANALVREINEVNPGEPVKKS